MSSTTDAVVVDGTAPGQPSGAWLHGVVRDVDTERLASISGVDGQPVRPVRAADLTAVVSTAHMAEYGEDALRRNLEDLGWLERTARAHHLVVDALFRIGPVIPARLATVYHDERRVAEVLTESRAEFAATLDRLAGRTEWGVKGYVVPGAPTPPETGGAGGSGTAYLRRRRAQLIARDEGQQAAGRDAAAVHDVLSARAVAARRHPPQDRRLSGADTAMVLNGAYLVESAQIAAFSELVRALSGRHPAIRLQLTGPWPPYSFAGDGAVTSAVTGAEQ